MFARRTILILLAAVQIAVLILLAAATARSAFGGQITLAWDPNDPAPDGYRLFQRQAGQAYDYTAPIWQGTDTMAPAEGLVPGTNYHFVVRAYVGTDESGDSNEVAYTVPVTNPPGPVTGIKLNKEGNIMFLISEPKPAKLVDYFNVELDGNVFASDPQVDGDQKRLHHDLSGIEMGDHTVRVQAVNDWGEDVWSGPFEFTAALPGAVSGIGLSKD